MGKKECSQVAKESRSMFFLVMGSPSRVISPSNFSRFKIHFSNVVFPAPFSPNRPTSSPGENSKFIPVRAFFSSRGGTP